MKIAPLLATAAGFALTSTLGLSAAGNPGTDNGNRHASGAEETIVISDDAERPAAPAPQENFTGEVIVKPLYSANETSPNSAGRVTFSAGARSDWHTHPAGQRLIITDGTGWVQEWNGERREFHTGDVVWIPEGVKHWHGATTDQVMTHIAVQDAVDGVAVTWMENVTNAQYLDRRNHH